MHVSLQSVKACPSRTDCWLFAGYQRVYFLPPCYVQCWWWPPGATPCIYLIVLQILNTLPHSKKLLAYVCYAKSLQSCPTLCDPIDGSPPGSSVPGILQARTLEWVAISYSSTWKWKVKVKSLSRVRLLATPWTAAYPAPPSMGFSRQEYWSRVPLPSPCICIFLHFKLYICSVVFCVLSSFSCVWLFATLWTVAHQAPLSMGFFRQEYWNGLQCPPAEDLPNPGTEPASPASNPLKADSLSTDPPGKPHICSVISQYFQEHYKPGMLFNNYDFRYEFIIIFFIILYVFTYLLASLFCPILRKT